MPSADTTVSPSKGGTGSMKAKMLALNTQLEDQVRSFTFVVRSRYFVQEELAWRCGGDLGEFRHRRGLDISISPQPLRESPSLRPNYPPHDEST